MSTHSMSRLARNLRRLLLVVAVAGLGGLAALPAVAYARGHHSARSGQPIAVTRDGVVRGFATSGVDKFLGIPYAAPPVGSLRWRAPQPPAGWHGVRDARTLPPACPQLANSNGPRSENEDCLYLSVYVPRDQGHDRGWGRGHGRGLPVLFWIHGGGLTTGTGNQHDGTLMATTNHMIVVSINYRLGVFGFLALPALSAEAPDHASGDYGLLDQIAALRWTRDNIAAFGGDPRNVTIAGESAGGYSVCSLLTSPPARGLFARAAMESGSCTSTPRATPQPTGAEFAAASGCTDPTASCMRSMTAGQLLDNPNYPGGLSPTWGGSELPADPATAVAAGRFTRVPLLIGTNHDEGRTFAQGLAGLNEQQYEGVIKSSYGANAPAVLAKYPFSSFPSPYTAAYAVGAAWTDSGFLAGIGGCAAQSQEQTFRRYTPVFAYQFDDRNAPGLNDSLPGYMWGAGHAMELAYMWPSFDNGIPLYPQLTPAQHELSDWMVRYWGAFARFGTPLARGQTYWPPYQSGKMMSLRQGNGSTAISDAEFGTEHNCSFWNSLPAG